MTDMEQIDADLDAYIIGDLIDEYDPDTEPRTLADADQADRALRRVGRIETTMVRHERLFDARAAQINERKAEVLGVLDRERQWWLRRAELWGRAHASETGSKLIKLPSGSIQFRQGSERIEALTKSPADDAPADFVRISRAWDKNAIKAATERGPVAEGVQAPEGFEARHAVTADGEVLADVVRLVPLQDSITIKAGGEL